MLEARGAFWGDVLSASIDVGLDHDTSDGSVASFELSTNVGNNDGLVVVVLGRVGIYTQEKMRLFFRQK